jgi:transcriptional antiterminator Rof (Rho-off)
MDHTPIACVVVDNLEVACLYHYQLRIQLSEGELEGEALDLTRNDHAEECLRLKAVEGIRDVPLRQIVLIEAKTQNPYFQTLELNESKAFR